MNGCRRRLIGAVERNDFPVWSTVSATELARNKPTTKKRASNDSQTDPVRPRRCVADVRYLGVETQVGNDRRGLKTMKTIQEILEGLSRPRAKNGMSWEQWARFAELSEH